VQLKYHCSFERPHKIKEIRLIFATYRSGDENSLHKNMLWISVEGAEVDTEAGAELG
jgi:hypothetical protein